MSDMGEKPYDERKREAERIKDQQKAHRNQKKLIIQGVFWDEIEMIIDSKRLGYRDELLTKFSVRDNKTTFI